MNHGFDHSETLVVVVVDVVVAFVVADYVDDKDSDIAVGKARD